MDTEPNWGKRGVIAAWAIGLSTLGLGVLTYVRPPDPNHPMKLDLLVKTVSVPLWLAISILFIVGVVSTFIARWFSPGRAELKAKILEITHRLDLERKSGEEYRIQLQNDQREISKRDGRIAALERELVESGGARNRKHLQTENSTTRGHNTQDIANEIQYMTDEEREIIAYLLAHNQKIFTNSPDCRRASTLVSKGIVVPAVREGQTFTYQEMPFKVPDEVWAALKQHQTESPYQAPPQGETEPDPWRRHWME